MIQIFNGADEVTGKQLENDRGSYPQNGYPTAIWKPTREVLK